MKKLTEEQIKELNIKIEDYTSSVMCLAEYIMSYADVIAEGKDPLEAAIDQHSFEFSRLEKLCSELKIKSPLRDLSLERYNALLGYAYVQNAILGSNDSVGEKKNG